MIEKAKKEVSVQSEIAERIKAESSKMKEKLANIYKSHMELINSIPSEVDDVFSGKVEVAEEISSEPEVPKMSPEEKVNRIINAASVDIFSEPEEEAVSGVANNSTKEKFRNLEFGENYNPNAEESDKDQGLYNGIFEK